MMRVRPASMSASLSLLLAAPAIGQLEGRTWTHEPLGIRMQIPDDFTLVPLQIDEKWILAKFLSDKTYLSKDRDWNREHRPLLRVIAFTEEAKKPGAGVEVEEEGNTTFIGIGAVPYQGYRDYVKRHRKGFFFAREEEGEVAGEGCLLCVAEVHKSVPELRLISMVFRRPTFEVAVEFEILEDRKDQLERMCWETLNTVRFFEPTLANDAPDSGADVNSKLWTAFRSEWRKRPLEQRIAIRRSVELARHRAVRESTPEDWKVSESPSYLVVSHCDDKFTERMVQGAEIFRAWCEEEFGELSDEYVRRGVLRLCRDRDEFVAFHFDSSNTTGWSLFGDDHEISTYRDNYNGTSGRDVGYMFDDILRLYLQEKDPYIIHYTPAWLAWALTDHVSNAIVKGRRLDFRVDDWVRDESRNMQRDGNLASLRSILEMDEDTFFEKLRGEYRLSYAATQALRFVLGPGQRHKCFRNFLPRYFEAVVAAAERREEEWKGEERVEPQTEEEEEALAKKRRDKYKARRKQLQAEINAAVLGSLDDRDWARLEKAFEKFVKAGK